MQTRSVLFNTLLIFCLSSPIHAEDCAVPTLINGMDINIPCVSVNGGQFATILTNQPVGEFSWQWSGEMTPMNCEDNSTACVQVDGNMNLAFPALDIGGAAYTAALDHAPDLGQFNWRYRSHTAKATQAPTEQTTQLTETSLNTLRQYMSNLVEQGQVPGAVLAVATGKQTAFLEAFGQSDMSQGTAITTDTLFHIGSTHKALTSFLLAILVDEGVLTWDTRAQEIYPQFTLSNPDYASQITIRHLLDMTSGLPKETDVVFDTPTRTVLEGLGAVKLLGAPGAQYEYSNLSVSVAAYLGVLAQAKTDNAGIIQDSDLDNLHASYERMLREKVLQPLGMTHSYLYVNDARATGNLARSHVLNDTGTFTVSESTDEQVDNLAPAGGLKSTAGDMLRYLITELLQGVTPEGNRLVSEANMTIRQTLSPGPASQDEYGLCLEIKTLENGVRYIGHAGSYDNFNSTIGFFPEQQVAFVLLTNGDSSAISDLTEKEIQNKIAEVVMQN